jgi:hypothetical protein
VITKQFVAFNSPCSLLLRALSLCGPRAGDKERKTSYHLGFIKTSNIPVVAKMRVYETK